jgi:hypothetical protein
MLKPQTDKLIQELQVALETTIIFTVSPHYERWDDGFNSLDTARRVIGKIKVDLEHAGDTPPWAIADLAQIHGQLNDFVPLRDDFRTYQMRERQDGRSGDSHSWPSRQAAERALDQLQRSVASLRNNIRSRVSTHDAGGVSRTAQQVLAFAFGIVFIVTILVLAVKFPQPTPMMYTAFRVVLALAAAGVAAMIPGFIYVNISEWLRTGGAMAVFAVVYFNNPAALVSPAPSEPDPTAPFSIALACKSNGAVVLDTYTFPFGDVKKNDAAADMAQLIEKLPNQRCAQRGASIFRVKDEVLLGGSNSPTATGGGNLGVISIPPEIVQELGGNHMAFTRINLMH